MRLGQSSRLVCVAGFTLLEVLVVLGITSVLAGLVLQLLLQAFRLDSTARRQFDEGAPASVRQLWLRDAIGAAQADTPDDRPAFEGSSTEVSLVTPDSLAQAGPAYGRLILSIERSPEGDSTLRAISAGAARRDSAADEAPASALLRWPVAEVRFRYRGQAGDWVDSWPPATAAAEAQPIPTALMVEVTSRPSESLVVRIPNTPKVLPPRQNAQDD
jgi:prepilin-type N-terminal cleavage/methylation domain-containing protein